MIFNNACHTKLVMILFVFVIYSVNTHIVHCQFYIQSIETRDTLSKKKGCFDKLMKGILYPITTKFLYLFMVELNELCLIRFSLFFQLIKLF